MRLPPLLVLGRVDEHEVLPQPEVRQRRLYEAVLRRRGHSQRQVPLGAQRNGVLGARFELALRQHERDDAIDDGHGHLGRRRRGPRVAGVPVLGHLTDEHAFGAAAAVARKRDAEPTEDLHFGFVPQDLRVEEEPVHVEDGRGEPLSR